ncbi:MAG TPA: hypothetical protein VHQ21_00280 [Rhodanobacteraceae bacterium]|jgi:hypothetical protein|nr:hypothetical protein [Rhodanobacteraceae bacterium]
MHKFVFFLTLAASGESSAANLITNADFDAGIAGWNFSGGCGDPAWDDVVGSPATGALAINCVSAPSAETATQCIAVAATSVDFSVRAADNGSAGPADFILKTYPSPDCSGTSNGAFAPADVKSVPGTACCGNTWRERSGSDIVLPPGTRSALVEITAHPGADIALDHVVLAPNVFQNGFQIAGYISGNWFNVDQGGSGFQIEATNAIDAASGLPVMLAIWFTYTPDGSSRNWIYAQGTYDRTKATTTLPAFLSAGGKFPPSIQTSDVTADPWGTLTFTFTDCDHGVASWNSVVPGYGSGSLPIVRLTSIDGTACP